MTRFNEINIQMLSKALHQVIFKTEPKVDKNVIRKIVKHLEEQKLWGKETEVLPDVDINLPKLYGDNIDEHFKIIGSKYAKPYKMMLKELILEKLPSQPKKWMFQPGWTRYTGNFSESVPFPTEKCYVFDIEICVKEGNFPTLATAASPNAWYSWCSEKLVNEQFNWESDMSLSHLIPLETSNDSTFNETSFQERLVIGHNVSFDRSFVKEQYLLQGSKLRFLDTMSLHMCVSGLTGIQRAMSMASKRNKTLDNEQSSFGDAAFMWLDIGSLNNLPDVYKLYCEGEPIQKDIRDVFVTGTIDDVRRDFQNLVNYCARDVTATFEIVQKLMPMFYRRFPHPVTLAGMLEMSVPYLPVNQNWNYYLKNSQAAYDDLKQEMKLSLGQVANNACSLLLNEKYKSDPWLWDLDWKTQDLKMNKIPSPSKRKKETVESVEKKVDSPEKEEDKTILSRDTDFEFLIKSAQHLRKVRPFLPGYPLWYRELCIKPNSGVKWEPGPALISTQIRSVPKLLRLMWDGYPLHYEKKEGWGYLVPKKTQDPDEIDQDNGFPLENFLKILNERRSPLNPKLNDSKEDFNSLISKSTLLMGDKKEESQLWQQILDVELINDSPPPSNKSKPISGVNVRGCDFYRLPHKDGPKNKVGNPLAKDFLSKITDGTLTAYSGNQATRALTISKMISYWKNAHKRITSQMTVWLKHQELPDHVIKNELYDDEESYGAILPRLVTAGTVTRRAVEPTWLTASNAYIDRVGSELKGMVQSPPGYHFVGADVDSEELWIAAVIGDSYFAGMHGCTAFSWMTLQGKKSEGTDLHSRTAVSVGITRDQAKVLNYGRIYGAGLPFAQRLLMQFNHRLLEEDAATKAKKMYSETKGVKKRVYLQAQIDEYTDAILLSRESMEPQKKWFGGSESHMFNKLEEIANSEKPTTPVLECRISRSLEPATVNNNFMTSRINWVVQSSAVDFLHLMVVCMKWLMDEHDIKGRFAISIHDEVRYLVQSEDRYRAALALQITNLLTRSLFAYKLNMHDLPQSVAFFSAVDIDKCLRKEVTLDCKTPSNPHGLEKGYGIPKGESLDIHQVLKITNGTICRS